MRRNKPKWAQSHHSKPRRIGGRRERARLRALCDDMRRIAALAVAVLLAQAATTHAAPPPEGWGAAAVRTAEAYWGGPPPPTVCATTTWQFDVPLPPDRAGQTILPHVPEPHCIVQIAPQKYVYNLCLIVLHEAGHTHGIEAHSPDPHNLMYGLPYSASVPWQPTPIWRCLLLAYGPKTARAMRRSECAAMRVCWQYRRYVTHITHKLGEVR